jgi:hypothetical protein
MPQAPRSPIILSATPTDVPVFANKPQRNYERDKLHGANLGAAILHFCEREFSDSPDIVWYPQAYASHVLNSIVKFGKGFREHGGSILDRNMTTDLLEESIDLPNYLLAQKEIIRKVHKIQGGI